jgi:uncharacterized protein (DUF1778 family)
LICCYQIVRLRGARHGFLGGTKPIARKRRDFLIVLADLRVALQLLRAPDTITHHSATSPRHSTTPRRANAVGERFLYGFIPYAKKSGIPNEGGFMPRALAESGRVELRLRTEDKATLTRAASLKRLDLTGYILRTVLPQAQADIAEAEKVVLSSRDSLSVLALLETPPPAPDRLARAAKAGFFLP